VSEAPGGFTRVMPASAIAVGDIVGVEVGGVPMILYRVRDRIVAAQRRCPHQGNDLVDGLLSGGSLLCPAHGWRFDAATGAHDGSSVCLVTYPVRVVDGDIEVRPEKVIER
jgi:nitrite reductase/ring-hydroxylating ferredoxin subunit